MVICLERDADAYGPADATATHCHFSKIQIGFSFLVPAHPGCPGKRAVKRVLLNGCVSSAKTRNIDIDSFVIVVLSPDL